MNADKGVQKMDSSFNIMLVGITVVFSALILLTVALYLFTGLMNIKKDKEQKNDSDNNVISDIYNATQSQAKTDIVNDNALIAVLTAAISSCMSRDVKSNLVIRSYRRISTTSPVWNTTGRIEQINN